MDNSPPVLWQATHRLSARKPKGARPKSLVDQLRAQSSSHGNNWKCQQLLSEPDRHSRDAETSAHHLKLLDPLRKVPSETTIEGSLTALNLQSTDVYLLGLHSWGSQHSFQSLWSFHQ